MGKRGRPGVWASAVITEGESAPSGWHGPAVTRARALGHLDEGDIVAVHASGTIQTLFRARSSTNAMFVTDRCNSNCLMCSQPP